MNMNYKELIKGARSFKNVPLARFYDEYMEEKNYQEWEERRSLSDSVVRKLFEFINSWDRHFEQERDKIAEFRNAYKNIYALLRELERETIYNIAFEEKVGKSTLITHSQAIFLIFEEIAHCFKRYESTDTSKIIHTLNPRLFVMWDNAICYHILGIEPTKRASGYDYAYRFMPLMQRTVKKIIKSYMGKYRCNQEEVVKRISQCGDNKTLAKLIDEYNWIYKNNPEKLKKAYQYPETCRFPGIR